MTLADSVNIAPVTYLMSQTTHILNIEPRFGSVNGGDIITFRISKKLASSKVVIHVDGVLCINPVATKKKLPTSYEYKKKEFQYFIACTTG